jgi:hypothetical protein
VAPHRPTPSQSLGQGIDLVVVTSGEGKKFGGEILKPRCPLGKSHRTVRGDDYDDRMTTTTMTGLMAR